MFPGQDVQLLRRGNALAEVVCEVEADALKLDHAAMRLNDARARMDGLHAAVFEVEVVDGALEHVVRVESHHSLPARGVVPLEELVQDVQMVRCEGGKCWICTALLQRATPNREREEEVHDVAEHACGLVVVGLALREVVADILRPLPCAERRQCWVPAWLVLL